MIDNNFKFKDITKDIIVFYNKNEKPYISVPHLHSQYEIYYNISGAKGFMAGGNYFKCTGHDLIIIPQFMAHKVIVSQNIKYERCIININEYIVDAISSVCNNQETLQWLKNSTKIVKLSDKSHETFISLITEYNKIYNTGNELALLSEFIKILTFIQSQIKNSIDYISPKDDQLTHTDKVMLLIEEKFKRISVNEIASEIFVNSDYINKIFKEETGITIQQYLTTRKIAEAKKYLYLGKSVKEAAMLSGFNNYANFIRTFKNYEGYSPGELDELTKPI